MPSIAQLIADVQNARTAQTAAENYQRNTSLNLMMAQASFDIAFMAYQMSNSLVNANALISASAVLNDAFNADAAAIQSMLSARQNTATAIAALVAAIQ